MESSRLAVSGATIVSSLILRKAACHPNPASQGKRLEWESHFVIIAPLAAVSHCSAADEANQASSQAGLASARQDRNVRALQHPDALTRCQFPVLCSSYIGTSLQLEEAMASHYHRNTGKSST